MGEGVSVEGIRDGRSSAHPIGRSRIHPKANPGLQQGVGRVFRLEESGAPVAPGAGSRYGVPGSIPFGAPMKNGQDCRNPLTRP